MSGHKKWSKIKHKKDSVVTIPYCTKDTDSTSIAFHGVFAALNHYVESRGGLDKFREVVKRCSIDCVTEEPEIENTWLNEARTLALADWYASIDWTDKDPQEYQGPLEKAIRIRQTWWV